MEQQLNKLLTHHTTTERKTPSEQGVNRNSVSKTSTPIVANTAPIAKHIHIGGAVDPLRGGGDPFPSLSKGTRLASNLLTDTHTPETQVQTITKVYPNKVMHIQLKFPYFKRGEKPEIINDTTEKERTEEQINDSIDSSLRRTRREIADIVDCNDFDMFATLTFDPKKHPLAKDYEYAKKIVIKWLKNQQLTHGAFRYVLVPERQSNGNIHFHALLGGFTGKYHKTNTRGNADNKRQCFKINSWEARYGFADMEEIGNKEATGRYIGKYITKEMTRTQVIDDGTIGKHTEITKKHEKRYFASQGLNKPVKQYNEHIATVVKEQNLDKTTADEYENDFAIITTYRKND